jgi:DNA-binding NarL/FixJ family response regulator
MLRIMIADDHELIRKGLEQILRKEFPFAVVDEANDAEEVIKKLYTESYDVIICDLSMPGRSGLEVVEHVKANYPAIPVLILSLHPEEKYAVRVLKAGAAGYISKDAASEVLVKAIHQILQGRKYISWTTAEKLAEELHKDPDLAPHQLLSNREYQIFIMLAEGKSIMQIGNILSLGVTTVSTYRTRLLAKMKMRTNAELVRYALERKLL